MRITIVVGGRWHAFDLARELNTQGHLHRLITNYPRWFVQRWDIPAEKIVSLPFTFWIVKAIYKLGGESLMMRCQWIVHRWFANHAAHHLAGSELIHGWSSFSEPSFKWANANNIPTVLERSSVHILEQSRILREEYSLLGLKWEATHPLIQKMEQQEYKLCSQIAVPSLFVERSFLERGFSDTKIFRNLLGVNSKQFQPPNKTPVSPITSGLKVIFAGTLSIQKGVHHLLEGFTQANIIESHLTLLGGETRELSHLLNLKPNNVSQLGHRPQKELAKHYQLGHCFVLASIQDGMGMVLIQALACGLPIICTTNTGGEDLLRIQKTKSVTHKHGVTEFDAGYVVPIRSAKAIAWCLIELATKPGLWEAKRKSALELENKSLTWKAYATRAASNYKKLIHS